MDHSPLTAARVLMGDSLGFHIIFVLLGLTLPILVVWFEYLGIRRNDEKLIHVAKFWSKIMALLVITGVVSGTVIALQMSLVWPGVLKFGGKVIGLPFMFETYAFLIEASFLALYMTTWNHKRVSKWAHWLFGIGVVVGSTLSAYAITSVNGWMNLPTGFEYKNGELVNINIWQAMFSRTALIEFFHSMPGYYIAASLLIVGGYAIKLLLKNRKDRMSKITETDRFILKRLMVFAMVMFLVSGITADITGKYLAKYEPAKLAAIELNYNTRSNAPLLIGGVGKPDQTIAGPHFEIPNALSILAGNSPDTKVQGLNEFKESERPPLYVHTLFDIKMTIITFMVVAFVGLGGVWLWRRKWTTSNLYLLVLVVLAPLGVILVELGWMMTEIGRQPWAVRAYVTTQEALTKTHDVRSFGYIFPLAYVALFIVTIWGVKRIIEDERAVRPKASVNKKTGSAKRTTKAKGVKK